MRISQTVTGVVVAGVAGLLSMLQVEVVEQDLQRVVELALLVLGVVVALLGRGKAEGPASWAPAIFRMLGMPDTAYDAEVRREQRMRREGGFLGEAAHALVLLFALVLLIVALLLPTGCALKSMEPHEQARTYAVTMSGAYEEAHAEYLFMYDGADEDGRAWLQENVQPALEDTRDALIFFNDLVITWEAQGEKPQSYSEALAMSRRSLNNLLRLIATASEE